MDRRKKITLNDIDLGWWMNEWMEHNEYNPAVLDNNNNNNNNGKKTRIEVKMRLNLDIEI